MQKMLCSLSSLAIIGASLAGCATPPPAARPTVTGPEVYGYTLNQPLSGEQFQKLNDAGKNFEGSLRLYRQFSRDGSQLGLYANAKLWLDTVTYTSTEFYAEGECLIAQQTGEAQLKQLIDGFNARQARSAGAPRQVGDVYASQAVDACQRIGGKGPGAEAFRFTLWATLQTESLAPTPGFPRKVEDTQASAWQTALVIVLLPVVAVASVMGGNGCRNTGARQESEDYCDQLQHGAQK